MGEPPRYSGIEWLDAGPPDPSPPELLSAGHRISRQQLIVVAIIALLIAAAVVAQLSSHRRAAPAARATTSAGPAPTTTNPSISARQPNPAPTTIVAPHPLLGITTGWELFLRSKDAVVRVQFPSGRITTTPVPALESGGGVSFLTTPTGAIVWPSDSVGGYRVTDGKPATPLGVDGTLGGAAFPGPQAGQVWVQTEPSFLLLYDASGQQLGSELDLPTTALGPATSDGSGGFLVRAVGGTYELSPTGTMHRITTGVVIAVGPNTFLAYECNPSNVCAIVAIDKASAQRRALQTDLPDQISLDRQGTISPDGRKAVVPLAGFGNSFVLLDLRTGHSVNSPIQPIANGLTSTYAWSPDSRFLFVVGDANEVDAIAAATNQATTLTVPLPPIQQLAIRPAG